MRRKAWLGVLVVLAAAIWQIQGGCALAGTGQQSSFQRLKQVQAWKVNIHLVFKGSKDGHTVDVSSDWTGQIDRINPDSDEDFSWNADLPVSVHGSEVWEYNYGGHHDIKTYTPIGTTQENMHLILTPGGYEFGFGHSQIQAAESLVCSKNSCSLDLSPIVCFSRSLTIKVPLPTQGKVLSGSGTYDHANSDVNDQIDQGFSMRVKWSFVPVSDELEAIPVVAATVQRGETLLLDGSQSTGNITDYQWTLSPKGGGGAGSGVPAKTMKHGAQSQVVVLDGLDVKLTVTDGKKTSTKTVSVGITARPSFRTHFEHVSQEGTLPDSSCPKCVWTGTDSKGEKTFYGEWVGGENVCAVDPPEAGSSEPPHIFHPDPKKAAKDDLYTLVEVKDPQGPWDGFFYFKDWKVEVKRQTRLNRFLQEEGPPCPGMKQNLYQGNVAQHNDVTGYLAAVRKHEHQHSDLMAQALSEADPARETEKAWGKDKQKLQVETDKRIQDAGKVLHDRAKDPREEIWRGNLAIPQMGTSEWRTFEVKVGGPGYGGF